MNSHIPSNLGLALVRATESAALSAGRWMGLGKPEDADRTASKTILEALNNVDINGTIVLSDRKPDRPARIKSGSKVGNGDGPQVDVVIDAIDGVSQLSKGYPGAVAVVAVSPHGTMWAPAPAMYMDKIVVNAEVAPYLVTECMMAPAAWTLALVARAKNKEVSDLTVFLLDRPRHIDLINEIQTAGARVMLRADGDISKGLQACMHQSGVDILMGAGGIPEGLLLACAVKALGGAMLGRLDPQSSEERDAIKDAMLDPNRVLNVDELVSSEDVFFAATGITDGSLLTGVRYMADRATTNSLIMRGATKIQRRLFTQHLMNGD